MKKLFVFLCLLVISISFSFAQDTLTVENSVSHVESPDSLALIDNYMQLYQYRKALGLLETIRPDKALLEKKALCHANLYEYPQAIEILEKLSKQNPKDISLKLKLISIYEPTQKYSKTLNCYNELLELDPTNDYYKIQRANFLYTRENYAESLAQYKNVCDSCDNNFLVKRQAMCLEKLNDTKAAKYLYARAWDLDTTDGYSATSLVKFLIKDRQYDLAVFASDRYMKFDSTYMPMNSLNAFAYYCSDSFNEAARRFQKCLERGDSSLLVVRTLGYAHFFMERDSLANYPLELAYRKDTADIKVLYPLAQTCANLHDYPRAILYYKELMKIKVPTEEELYGYYKGLAEAYLNNKDYKLAVGELHKALQHVIEYQDKVELSKKMAHCLDYNLNEYPQAIHHYEAYRSGLMSREITLGGVEDDLTTLNLPKETIEKIEAVRAEMAEVDKRLEYLTDTVSKNYKIIYGDKGSKIFIPKAISDSIKAPSDSVSSSPDSQIKIVK